MPHAFIAARKKKPCWARRRGAPRVQTEATTGQVQHECDLCYGRCFGCAIPGTCKIFTCFLRLAQLTDDWELREFVAATLRVGPISASSGAQALAVADVRCRAFSGRLSVNDLIARRFELREAVRARLDKGAACLVATLEGPYPASLLARLEAEGLGGGAAGGTLIVGAVDVSTHEFALAPDWQKAFPCACYISDMAVTPACARLGVGARLLEAALALARQEGGEVFLHVEQDNAAALSLYHGAGFVEEAETAATRALFYALQLHEESQHNLLLRLHPPPSS